MEKKRAVAWLVCLVTMIACDGPVGPPGAVGTEGPQGEAGIQGAVGPGIRVVIPGVLDDVNSTTTVDLPPEYGDMSDPPLVGCYASPDGLEWYNFGGNPAFTALQCLLKAGQAGNVQVIIRRLRPTDYVGWDYMVVAVY